MNKDFGSFQPQKTQTDDLLPLRHLSAPQIRGQKRDDRQGFKPPNNHSSCKDAFGKSA